jgi:hypothetical protein
MNYRIELVRKLYMVAVTDINDEYFVLHAFSY